MEINYSVGPLTNGWRDNISITCCFVRQHSIYDKSISFHYPYVPILRCTGIKFEKCMMLKIPSSDSIKVFIPNLTVLSVVDSKLSNITSEDLMGFGCLRDLFIENCEIEYLPGDLFVRTTNLEIVSFNCNKIKYIDEKILDPLCKLKIFSLIKNVNINACYDIIKKHGNMTLAELKNEIKTKCSRIGLKKACDDQQKKISTLKENEEVQKIEIATLKEVHKKEIAELKRKYEDISGKFEDLKNICLDKTEMDEMKGKIETLSQQVQLVKQTSKDFTIKVNEKYYRVHKSILIAQSKVLAKLISDNPEADTMELNDISAATFQQILNFMNEGSTPSKDSNKVELFAATCRFEIEALTTIASELLKKVVTQANALDVIVLCNKYGYFKHNKLLRKAFAEFRKIFPSQVLMPGLASEPEKLKLMMQAKLEMDEKIAKLR